MITEIITDVDPAIRNRSLDEVCRGLDSAELLRACDELEHFRKRSQNLYERVRALFFLYAIHRFYLSEGKGTIPFEGYEYLLKRRFEEAIEIFRRATPSDAVSSALATAYHQLGFQTLADQVRRSVRSVRGNQWMFRMGHPADHPLRIRRELRGGAILRERTPVRMDLSHSGWSDIFFLGMDFPEGARVMNVSIDLGVRGRDAVPSPPVEVYLRVIDEPVLRLVSVDLGQAAHITELAEVFDFAKDYLGLLKAALIASGIVPAGIEGSGQSLTALLERMLGPRLGLELVSSVNSIPKGSRLAVSTSLLASLIAVCMRATGQAKSLTGMLEEPERRLVAARAILGEWLAGSGGGWQDSGGVWPGMKVISGVIASEGDPEFAVSRGRLLPSHEILDYEEAPLEARTKLQNSLVLVHGGMAQNVGPILEMVTEKYLLRSQPEWESRQQAMAIFDQLLAALREGDIRRIGELTTQNFEAPIQTIIPWANNLYTETLKRRAREEFGERFWGFWMLGGMSGGGMGFLFDPEIKERAADRMLDIMRETKATFDRALPFAMEPVVYEFSINDCGTAADLGLDLMPPGYYTLFAPQLLRQDPRALTPGRSQELERLADTCRQRPDFGQALLHRLLPGGFESGDSVGGSNDLGKILQELGFDPVQHERIRGDLKSGRIGLAQNRLPANTDIQDVTGKEVRQSEEIDETCRRLGQEALESGTVAVVTLAAGVGSRWTQGAGVVKALHPFCRLKGKYRSFIDVHLAKSRKLNLPHVFTTSYLTHEPIKSAVGELAELSPGRAVGLRLVPMVRDLRFAWEEMPQQLLDEQAQKVRVSLQNALIGWAQKVGEGSDYTDNLPGQCLHPVGHWYEVPNMMRNGVLVRLMDQYPDLKYLMVHNIDTLGVDVDAALLGAHIQSGACLSFEVITRKIEDRGGGLARVDGRVRLVEGLAMPREEDEFKLAYYNSNTCWIDIDQLLALFGLQRSELRNETKVAEAVRAMAARMPTYITLKEVKKRWGHGQEDIFPVAQFEKLWPDMTALGEVKSQFLVVSRMRGQQLKDQAQLDGWLRDGSAAYVERLLGRQG
jgi:hypothetical protein